MSHPAVWPIVVVEPPIEEVEPVPGVPHGLRLNDVPGKPGTPVGLGLRSVQLFFAIIALSVLASTDFSSKPAFCFLVAAAGLQCLWSFPLLFMDLYALALKRHLRDPRLCCLFSIGDGIVGILLLIAASASGGVSYQICSELDVDDIKHCGSFNSSTVCAFLSFFALLSSFFLNLSSLAS